MATEQPPTEVEVNMTKGKLTSYRITAEGDAENRAYKKFDKSEYIFERVPLKERIDMDSLSNLSSMLPEKSTVIVVEDTEHFYTLCDIIDEDELNYKPVSKQRVKRNFTIYEDNPTSSSEYESVNIPKSSEIYSTYECIARDFEEYHNGDEEEDGDDYDYYSYNTGELVCDSEPWFFSCDGNRNFEVLETIKEDEEFDEDGIMKQKYIFDAFKSNEGNFLPRINYMDKQPHITHPMRSATVDWMVRVAELNELSDETLFIAVNYLDRFLSRISISKEKIQFLGFVAVYLASNQNEQVPLDIEDFLKVMKEVFTELQVLKLGKLMMDALQTHLEALTAYQFASELLAVLFASKHVSTLTSYLVELTLMDGEKFLKYIPSIIATSCYCLANLLEGKKNFMANVTRFTGYHAHDLQGCICDIFDALHETSAKPKLAIKEKYSSHKKQFVAVMKIPEECPAISI